MKNDRAKFERVIRLFSTLSLMSLLSCGAQALRGPGAGQPAGDTGHNQVGVGGLEVSHEVGEVKHAEVPTGTQSADMMYRDTTYHPSVFQLVIRKRIEHASMHRAQAKALAINESEECRTVEPELRAQCPLLEAVEAADKIEGGVRLKLSAGVEAICVLVPPPRLADE